MHKGIDVSKWQGSIDWNAVSASGVEFAILKAGGSDAGFYRDPMFERNYAEAKAAGIPVGAYYFVGSKCTSYADGAADAQRFIQILSGKQFEYPVYIDMESTSPADKAGATQACIGFCKTMEEAGYYCGIYASDIYGFKDRLDISLLGHIDKWVARYGSSPAYAASPGMWQSSDKGSISGISGNVDLDIAYKDYPAIIKAAGLNGFTAAEKPPEQPVEPAESNLKAENEKLSDMLKRIKDILNE